MCSSIMNILIVLYLKNQILRVYQYQHTAFGRNFTH